MKCLIIQPIHEVGIKFLKDNNIDVDISDSAKMDYIETVIKPYDAVITRNAGLTKKCIDSAPNLLVIGNHGVGVNPIDVEHATYMGIPVINTPTANSQSVAEHVFGQILCLYRRLVTADLSVRNLDSNFRYKNSFYELKGKTIAIIGFGRIGKIIKRIAEKAFNMRVLTVSREDIWGYTKIRDKRKKLGQSLKSSDCQLLAVLREADVVSLNIPLTNETTELVDINWFEIMKNDALIVNTARGELINNTHLVKALEAGLIAGAALDVFDIEPLPKDHILMNAEGILLSPHIGGSTVEALKRTAYETSLQVKEVLNNKRPKHLVNPESWSKRRRLKH